MISKGLFTSSSDEWSTPQDLFDALNKEFSFTLDVCATHENRKCDEYFTREDDGLTREWYGNVWMNPPYGRQIGDWVRKAYEYGTGGGLAVALIPARTDTKYWHRYVMNSTEIRLIRGRVKFGNADTGAPFPSAVVIFSEKRHPRITDFTY